MRYETNSKNINVGDTFVALKGNYYDGHDFIEDAINNGASKVIGEKKENYKEYKRVKNAYKYLTKKVGKENKVLSSNFKIIGITGTKGKSTTAMLVYQMLNMLGVKAAYIGTLGLYYLSHIEPLENTTPDIVTLNKILRKLEENGITHIVMEVSSHSLVQKRVQGLKFNVAGFTNLSWEHLDYHKNMTNYLNAKLKILKYLNGPIILNNDDKASRFFKKKTNNYMMIGTSGDIEINDYTLYQSSMLINFSYNYSHYSVCVPLVGKHNIYNYLMALAIMIKLGFDLHDIINITNSLKPIKGRGEILKNDKGYVVIDYAHSPQAVKETLLTYNELKKGKIITIIGCGGNRDKTKRPIMGKIATELSDYVIFTSDNPRDENPKDILNDITKDLSSKNFEIIENRSQAIKKGVKLLKRQDYLLILGKGHEDYQIINNHKYHFDDKEEALKYLS